MAQAPTLHGTVHEWQPVTLCETPMHPPTRSLPMRVTLVRQASPCPTQTQESHQRGATRQSGGSVACTGPRRQNRGAGGTGWVAPDTCETV